MRNKRSDGLCGLTIMLIVLLNIIYGNRSIDLFSWIGIFGNTVFLLITSYLLGPRYPASGEMRKYSVHKETYACL